MSNVVVLGVVAAMTGAATGTAEAETKVKARKKGIVRMKANTCVKKALAKTTKRLQRRPRSLR
jgi:hypothetical protein